MKLFHVCCSSSSKLRGSEEAKKLGWHAPAELLSLVDSGSHGNRLHELRVWVVVVLHHRLRVLDWLLLHHNGSLRHVREVGAGRGNILDGSANHARHWHIEHSRLQVAHLRLLVLLGLGNEVVLRGVNLGLGKGLFVLISDNALVLLDGDPSSSFLGSVILSGFGFERLSFIFLTRTVLRQTPHRIKSPAIGTLDHDTATSAVTQTNEPTLVSE